MNNYPSPTKGPTDESAIDASEARIKLWGLLARQVDSYTMGESSSIPVETAQELLASICFTLGIGQSGGEEDIKNVLIWNLPVRFAQGLKALEAKTAATKRLWQAACQSAPKIENTSHISTLKSMGGFFSRYNYRYFAHEIPCDIDYQLCHPVPESFLGVDYAGEYLIRLLIEHRFLSRFSPAACACLLSACYPDYKGLLINLYEPVATNALGLALIGGDITKLNITRAGLTQIEALLSPLARDEAVEALQAAADTVCLCMGLFEPRERRYLGELSRGIYPRARAALEAGNLGSVFQSFSL